MEYSRGQYAALPPTTDADLTTPYSASDYVAVETVDTNRVEQLADGGAYAVHQFKDYVGDGNRIVCVVQQSGSPGSPMLLQIYNRVSQLWETLDSQTGADDVDVTFTETIADVSDYIDARGVVSCRVVLAALPENRVGYGLVGYAVVGI